MAEIIFYERREASFESFPAENYVDYMTNVMPIPEKHLFYLPLRGKVIACEVRSDNSGGETLVWAVEEYDKLPMALLINVDIHNIDDILAVLIEGETPHTCRLCDEVLGSFLDFYQ
jgi:hypothetical protein